MVGSLARFMKSTTFSIEPFSSKSLRKNLAVSMLTPIAPKMMEKFSEEWSAVSLPFTRQTSCGEQGQLLAAHHRVHCVDSTDSQLDHLLRVDTRLRVHRGTVDIQELLSEHCRALVDRLAR